MFFGIFVLIRVSILSIFVLNRASFNFLDDKQPARMFYELNYSKNFYLSLSYTGHGFGLNVLHRLSKIAILS